MAHEIREGANNVVVSKENKQILFLQDGVDSNKVPVALLNELWEELLIEHGACWGRVISSSMHPMIKRGDQVLVERALSDRVRFGDVAVFRRNGQLMTHRILGKREFRQECHFLEKGDALLHASIVPVNNIIGRVCAIRNSRRTVQMISGRGRILQLVLAFISYTSMWLWAVLKHCLTFRGRTLYRYRYRVAYNEFFSLVRRIMLLPLR